MSTGVFELLEDINSRPKPFGYYTASDLWTNEHTSQQMLSCHLNGDIDVSSRKTDFVDRSVDWIAAHFHVGDGTRIADFGCGPGLYASRLAARQARVTGVDFSRRSIQYAKDQATRDGVSIDYICQNYLDYMSDERFDLILMIMCDFCALSPAQRKTMLEKFHALLESGGHVLMDVHSLHFFGTREEKAVYELNQLNGFWSPNRYYGFVSVFKYEDEKVTLDKYTIIEPNRTWTVYNWLQCFSPEILQREFEDNGFVIESILSDVAGKPFDAEGHEFAVVARKS